MILQSMQEAVPTLEDGFVHALGGEIRVGMTCCKLNKYMASEQFRRNYIGPGLNGNHTSPVCER